MISNSVAEWAWKVALMLAGVAIAYFSMQTNLSIITLELKLEKQRVEDIQSRPSNKDFERIERQIEEIRQSIGKKGKN